MIARYDELNDGNENAAITEIDNGSPRDGQQGQIIEDELAMLKADPLTALYEKAEELGFGPQKDQFVGVILACVSAASGRPVNIQLCGEYSAGKSTTIKAATEFVGPDYLAAKGSIQKFTAAAASRLADRITGRCVVFDERFHGNDDFDSLIRMAASGQTATRTILVGGEPTELTIRPPISIVDAMLSDQDVSRQDRSRYLRLKMNADQVTRDQISALNVERYTMEGIRRQTQCKFFGDAFQIFLAGLNRDFKVIVPFAKEIRIDTQSRVRDRLIEQVLNATCCVAWLRQGNRQKLQDSVEGTYLNADPDDYRIIYDIVIACGEDGADEELSDNAMRLHRMWLNWIYDNGNRGLARKSFDAVTKDEINEWKTYRALRELDQYGYATGPKGRGHIGEWRMTDLGMASDHPNLFGLLPNPNELAGVVLKRNTGTYNDLSNDMGKISSLAEEANNEYE